MILAPTTYEEVQDCFRQSGSLSIHSADSQEQGGSLLSLSHFTSVLLYEPEEMIIQVQAGMTIDRLNQTLANNKQWIPTLVAGENIESTIGAALANDRYHPRAQSLGALRTTVLGGTFVAADGTLFKSGSRVVKSVAGYDIHRAFCGSRGSFGAILDVTLKVQPLPEAFLWFDSSTDELAKYYPSICERTTGTFCELAGYLEDIEHDRNELANAGIIQRSYTEDEAHAAIRSIIKQHALTPVDTTQLASIRNVFDPKGILR